MTEAARLEVIADSTGVRKATEDLDKLAKSGERAERATNQTRDSLGRFTSQARSSTGVVGGLTNMFGSLSKLLAGLGAGYAVGMFFNAIIRNTIEAEQVQAQLEARLKSTGEAAGFNLQQLNAMAKGLQGVTTYGDEAIGTVQSLLLTFTSIKGENFARATEGVLDLATALRTDASSAALQLGKALNNPIKGVSALGRAGVQFSEDQKAMIKSLVETGDMAGAQTIILDELATQMGGSARAARDTLGGALTALKEAFGDALEGDTGTDGARGMVSSINNLTEIMQSPDTKAGFQTMIQGMANIASFAAETITMIAGVTREIGYMTVAMNEASRDALISKQIRLEDDLRAIESPGTFDDLMRARLNGDGISLLRSVEDNAASVKKELAGVIEQIDALTHKENAAARASAASSEQRASGAQQTEQMSEATQKLVDALTEEAAVLGLSRAETLEYAKAQALAEAANDTEKAAITEAYDALIAKTRAEESATAAKKGSTAASRDAAKAEREAAQAERERASTLETLDGILDSQAATIGGPMVVAAQSYAQTMVQLLGVETKLTELGSLTADAMTKLAIARQQAADAYAKETAAIQAQLTPGEQMLADLKFEVELMQMSNVERATAIQLRGLETAEAIKYGDAIRATNVELENTMRATEGLDVVRSSFKGLLTDIAEGTKSAKDIFMDFLESVIQGLTELIAKRLMEQAFGSMGQAGGGAAGNGLMDLFGALLGGAKAIGGPTSPDRLHKINEQGPEVFSDGRNDWLLPTGRPGKVTPAGRSAGGGGTTNITINVPPSIQRKTADQIANRTADITRTAQRRNR